MKDTYYDIIQTAFYRDKKKIDGQLYLPASDKVPLVIIAHGFGGSRSRGEAYARMFASHGIAAYNFDFIGGGKDILSDGRMTEMSVLSEAADLNIIIDGLRQLKQIDTENIFLHGRSQGGYVATHVAAHRNDIAGLILLYPAFMLQDECLKLTNNGRDIKDELTFLDNTVSRIYQEDLLKVDIYADIAEYPGPVLIMHGDADDIVPLKGTIDHLYLFRQAQLQIMPQGSHGFEGENQERALKLALEFVNEHLKSDV